MKSLKELLLTTAVGSLAFLTLGANVAIAEDSGMTTTSVNITNASGPLEFGDVPTVFDFTDVSVTGEDVDVPLSGGFNLSISDFRELTAENDGWNLTVNLTTFTSGGTETLEGASLVFTGLSFATTGSYGATEPSFVGGTVVSGGGETPLVSAVRVDETDLTGFGEWDITGNVSLEIDADEVSFGNHSAVLTWNLVDGF